MHAVRLAKLVASAVFFVVLQQSGNFLLLALLLKVVIRYRMISFSPLLTRLSLGMVV